MSAVLLLLAAAGILASAAWAPPLMRRAAPALVRVPLAAAVLLTAGAVLWLAALLAVGPVLAWTISGPVLPGAAGLVCQQCLAAANPFLGTAPVDTAIPVVVLLAVPALAAVVLAVTLGRGALARRRDTQRAGAAVRDAGTVGFLRGDRILIVPDDVPYAFALPARHGGVTVSTGALRTLDADELAGVLAHERAHLRQRHHLLSAIVTTLATHLRWIPLVAAVADAVPTYLEVAADDAARRRAGTTALAGALLKLGTPGPQSPLGATVGALNATGPDRIRHLVAPGSGRAGALPALAIGAHLGGLAVATLAVLVAYAGAVLSGCA